MITPNQTPWEPDIWRTELRNAIRNTRSLLDFVGVAPSQGLIGPLCSTSAVHSPTATPDFPTLVPRGFAARMEPGNAQDPLLRQVLAVDAESESQAGFVLDPLGENDRTTGYNKAPGLIKKYHGRALLITTSGCAVHCRYCFRRNFPYSDHREHKLTAAIEAIGADESIEEIILSGGDPLLLDDDALSNLISKLAAIPHLQRLRIHSRLPIVLPERVTAKLISILSACRLTVVMVIHTNHSNELDHNTARALANLKTTGMWLLNQSVLLRGINDCANTQIQLAKSLFDQGAQPYYLHLPDRVAGTQHFFVDDDQAQQIYQLMQANLSGYLLPKLVRELPGEASKLIVSG